MTHYECIKSMGKREMATMLAVMLLCAKGREPDREYFRECMEQLMSWLDEEAES